MIVCVCRGVSDNELNYAIQTNTLETFLKYRKLGSDCGLCMKLIKDRVCKPKNCRDCRLKVEHLIKGV